MIGSFVQLSSLSFLSWYLQASQVNLPFYLKATKQFLNLFLLDSDHKDCQSERRLLQDICSLFVLVFSCAQQHRYDKGLTKITQTEIKRVGVVALQLLKPYVCVALSFAFSSKRFDAELVGRYATRSHVV